MNSFNNFSNIDYVDETNYNIVSEGTDVWPGFLPFKSGDVFPPQSVKDRAAVSLTNKMIYNNDTDRIYASILGVMPEIDPMYGWQIREIVTSLPYFKNTTNYWVGLIAGDAPVVDGDEAVDIQINDIIEKSNWAHAVQDEVRSRFLDPISAVRIEMGLDDKPNITHIDSKNLIVYVNNKHTSDIEVTLIFNIYSDDTGEYVEFIEYHYNGLIKKTVFEYENGHLGRHVEDLDDEDKAFGGMFNMSPVVVFKHNTTGNEIYGTDQYRYISPSICGAMRGLQNILRLGERTREMIRKVPDSAITRDGYSGASTFLNKGTTSYPTNSDKSPDVEYVVPEIRMQEAIQAFEKAVKSIATDTSLGPVFFDLEKLGTNLSAKSIEAAMYPTKLEARRMTSELVPQLKEVVIRLAGLYGIDLRESKFSIKMFDGFPKDYKEMVDAVQKRLGDQPSISLEDAIQFLDKVPSRVAMQKAAELRGETKEETSITDENKETLDTSVGFTGTSNNKVDNTTSRGDDTLWEYQMFPIPKDIPVNKFYEAVRAWIKEHK